MRRYRVRLVEPTLADEDDFLDAVARSRRLHGRWVTPPGDAAAYRRYLDRLGRQDTDGFVVRGRDGGALVGVVNLSQIVYGSFRNAYLGYYGFAPHTGQGLMTEGVDLAVRHAFRRRRLHRVEANIQPGNDRSARLVERVGFRYEGFSPRYLKVAGRWRDHERWAILAEEWRPSAR